MANVFENLYQAKGLQSQRRYPNDALIGFLAGRFFRLPAAERSQVKVLELGCGSGANLWMVAREGFDAYGLDYAPSGLALCRQVLDDWGVSARLDQGDMTALPYENASFDAIFDVVSMQHLTLAQHAQVLAEVKRCLKPGGHFFSYHLGQGSSAFAAEVPRLDGVTLTEVPAGYPLASNGQTAFLSADGYALLAAQAGLVDIAVDKVVRSYGQQAQQVEYLVLTASKG
ncbi:class I SAM-dependent methyltransferase [Gallaecimonas kandeliae]|uniref:class I SAM-dependent methyltransferase n=1 Tax=Gallaecimonas kandeliae TaxID=3029055 RepID=UPI0026490E58|nr:class I SAM-dependent methyltransferase [Gallaecimonas kandeliae]WKE66724.1 class I SAM-dependent methyltransferase [Gallaecimonas kandeliae]